MRTETTVWCGEVQPDGVSEPRWSQQLDKSDESLLESRSYRSAALEIHVRGAMARRIYARVLPIDCGIRQLMNRNECELDTGKRGRMDNIPFFLGKLETT